MGSVFHNHGHPRPTSSHIATLHLLTAQSYRWADTRNNEAVHSARGPRASFRHGRLFVDPLSPAEQHHQGKAAEKEDGHHGKRWASRPFCRQACQAFLGLVIMHVT